MKNKKGFIFIETIICIVILMASFLTVFKIYFTTYQKYLKRYQNDHVQSIYKAYNIRYALEQYSNFSTIKNVLVNDNKLINLLGPNTQNLYFNDSNSSISFQKLLNNLGIVNVYLIKNVGLYYETCHENKDNKCNNLIFEQNYFDYLKQFKDNDDEIIVIEEKINDKGTLDYNAASVYTYIGV